MYFYRVKKLIGLLLLNLVALLPAQAQFMLRGRVVDSASQKGLAPVSIENMSTHQGTFSTANGDFMLEVKPGDYVYFTYVGYKNRSVRVLAEDEGRLKIVSLSLKPVQLKDVTIYRGPTEYQKDSASRASIYKDAFEYERQKSVMSPVTSLYQKFSKKHRSMERFHEQILDMEQQKFIDTRYSPELVQALTRLSEEAVIPFMQQYPMEYEYARAASDLEIKMWIKYNFQEYLAKRGQK